MDPGGSEAEAKAGAKAEAVLEAEAKVLKPGYSDAA